MDFTRIIAAFISIAALGGLLGLGLAFAAKLLAVKKDKRIEEIEESLAGSNCGVCGYAGCGAYAEAVVNLKTDITLCKPGGSKAIEDIAKIMQMNVSAGNSETMVAQVHCRGNTERTKKNFAYNGLLDCNAAHIYFGGDNECKYGCLRMGSCMKECPTDAIYYDEDGCVWVDKDKCISCEKCVAICPTNVMKMIPYSANVLVACNSNDKGGVVKKYCSVGCTGCKLCEKKSPEGGFTIDNFLAVIDYSTDGERDNAKIACPSKCIVSTVDPIEDVEEEIIKKKVVNE